MKTMIVPGVLLPDLQAVCNGVRDADPRDLLPWAWEVGDSLSEVAPLQPPTTHFFRGISSLILSAEKGANIPPDHSKGKLIRGLTELGDYRWRQVLLSGVVRGRGWAREIPDENRFIGEATAEAALRVTRFSPKSTIGLMREILHGKRKEVRVVPIRLRSGIQTALARQFLRKLHSGINGDLLAEKFDGVTAALLEKGAVFYALEFGAEPGCLNVWEELIDNSDLAHLDFRELSVLFKVFSFGWLSEELPSLIGRHPKGIEVCRYALQHHFAFGEAIEFCLKESDPFPRALKISERMNTFREGGQSLRKFAELDEIDKLALYALTVPLAGIGLRDKPPFPYELFLRDLEIYLFCNGGDAAQIMEPFSDFVRLSRRKWGPQKQESIYDLFSMIFQSVWKIKSFHSWLKKLHAMLADKAHPLSRSALEFAMQSRLVSHRPAYSFKENIEFLLIFHQANLRIPPPVVKHMIYLVSTTPRPSKTAQELRQHVQYYRQNPLIPPDSEEMTYANQIALWGVILEHLYVKEKNEIFYPSFTDLIGFSALERGKFLSEAAEDIAKMQRGLRPHTRFQNVVQKIHMKHDLKDPQKAARLRRGFLHGSPLLNRSFVKNLKVGADEAALELFERGYALRGKSFIKYAATPDRLKHLSAAERDVENLARGKPTGSPEDPFAILAMLGLLNDREYPVFGSKELLEIFGWMKVAPLHESVQLIPLEFTAMSQTFQVLEILDKRMIQNFCGEISRHFSLRVVVGDILGEAPENGSVPRAVLPAVLEYLKVSSVAEAIVAVKDLNEVEVEEVAKRMIQTMARDKIWNPKTVKRLLMAFTAENYLGTAEKIRIESFDKESSPDELLLTLDVIWNFFEIEFAETLGEFRQNLLEKSLNAEAKAAVEKMFHGKNFVAKERKRLKKIYETLQRLDLKEENVTLLPSRDKVDAFFGHVGGNCLGAKLKYGLYGFTDPTFVPFRILINGEWRGTILSFTRFIGERKVLILSGIDPQIPFKPGEFLDRLEENFAELARMGNYDLVLLTSGEGTISSRRAFLQAEAKRRYSDRILKVSRNIPLVKKSPEDLTNKKNYYGFHDTFFILVDRNKKSEK